MKNLSGKNWFYLILGAVGIVFFIVIAILLKDLWWLGLIGIALSIVLVLVALKPLFQSKSKNAEVFEGKFLYIGLDNEFYVGGVFEVDGKDKKVLIPKSVFAANRLAEGAIYKITYNAKKDEAISLERID